MKSSLQARRSGTLLRPLLAARGGTPARHRGDRGQTIRRPQARPPTAMKGRHMSLSDTVLTGPSGGRTVSSGHGSSTELKLAGEQSGGDWAVVEWRVRAGDEPPIHTHTREDETLYVLDGAITAFVADQRIEVDAGSYAALPKDVPHGLRVRGDEARLLVTLEPAGAEYFMVPRDENDADPNRFGLVLHGPAPTA